MIRVLLTWLLLLASVPGWANEQWVLEPVSTLRPAELKALQAAGASVQPNNQYRWWLDGGRVVQSVQLTEPDGTAHDVAPELIDPLSNCYLLMADTSLSMRPAWPGVEVAMNTWLDQLPAQSVALAGFAEDLTTLVSFNTAQTNALSRDQLKQAVADIELRGKDTQLYLAVNKAIETLDDCAATRRHLVVFSDGDAEDKAVTLAEVRALANEQHIAIHTVGFGDLDRSKTALKLQVLKTLSDDTQGHYFHYQGEPADLVAAVDNTLKHHTLAGWLRLDPLVLAYGVEQLHLTLLVKDQTGTDITLQDTIAVVGADQWDNLLITLSRRTGGTDPQLVMGGGIGLLVLFVLWRILAARARRKRAQAEQAEFKAEQAALKAEIRADQAAQAASIEASVGEVLESVKSKIDEFQPSAPVLEQGKPYGWLQRSDGVRYELIRFSSTIGRDDTNDVVIADDNAVSQQHAILDFKNGRFIWTDRAPTNPTRINDDGVLGSRQIQPGDRIVLGYSELTLVLA